MVSIRAYGVGKSFCPPNVGWNYIRRHLAATAFGMTLQCHGLSALRAIIPDCWPSYESSTRIPSNRLRQTWARWNTNINRLKFLRDEILLINFSAERTDVSAAMYVSETLTNEIEISWSVVSGLVRYTTLAPGSFRTVT